MSRVFITARNTREGEGEEKEEEEEKEEVVEDRRAKNGNCACE